MPARMRAWQAGGPRYGGYRKTQYSATITAVNTAATVRGSGAPVRLAWRITSRGCSQVSPSTFSGAGGGVSRLTTTNTIEQRQKLHQACIRKGIPSPVVM